MSCPRSRPLSRPLGIARLIRFTLLVVIAVLAALVALGAVATAHAQTSPAQGSIRSGSDMPMADFLGLLQQIAPAAAEGAKVYLGAYRLQCGRMLTTTELRQAIANEGGDPVLMGLIRAAQAQNTEQRAQLVRQIRCTAGGTR